MIARLRSLWRGVTRRGEFESGMIEEFRHHIELRTEHLVREGLPRVEAERRARVEFGHIESHRAAARASRGLRLIDQIGFSWLDVKLGARMLGKYPGLSLVSVTGLSVAIALGAAGFGVIHALVYAPLPLDEGDRVVSIQNADVRDPWRPDLRASYDVLRWRSELRTLRDVGAFSPERRSLTIPGRGTEVVPIARMSAAGFRLARVAPILGRPLLEADEAAGAPPVLVIGAREWRRRFDADPGVIGAMVRIDTVAHTVVGVMPEDFLFPISHRYWMPLRLDAATVRPREGPEVIVFARLAEGVDMGQAAAEVATLGRREAAAQPETHGTLRPRVLPYTHPFLGIHDPVRARVVRIAQYFLSLLLVAVASNVAVLVYARTATRVGEIVVRTALGASRLRVVTQLFAEALVLSLVAAVIGLTVAAVVVSRIPAFLGESAIHPFWLDLSLSPALIAYVLALAVLASLIVGVLPALRATGPAIQLHLQQFSSRGSAARLGRTWTALIVVQVAIAVAALPYALFVTGLLVRRGAAEPSYPIDEFLRATLSLEREGVATGVDSAGRAALHAVRFASGAAELRERLEADPAVAGVAFAARFPGNEELDRIEVEGVGARAWAWRNEVEPELLDVFDVPVLAGRGFTPADAGTGSTAVIVDQLFVDSILDGRSAVGRRVRRLVPRTGGEPGETTAGPWLEIVGVVPDFTAPPLMEPTDPKLFLPLAVDGSRGRLEMVVRVRPGTAAEAFVNPIRLATAAVDPALQLGGLRTAAEDERVQRRGFVIAAVSIIALSGSVLLLSSAGIYAMMSFVVASRRREIGIRAALGAAPRRLLSGIFAGAMRQLGAGVLGGIALAGGIGMLVGGGPFKGRGVLLLPAVAMLMVVIGLVAALGPARNGLAVQPTEALKSD